MSVVPFGKYKGRPVEDMLADADYMTWLGGQPWFRERFAHLGRVTEDELSRTPVHNRLQALFLDAHYCGAFGRAAASGELRKLEETLRQRCARQQVHLQGRLDEYRQKLASLPADSSYRNFCDERIAASEICLAAMRADKLTKIAGSAFEVSGADVVVTLELRLMGAWSSSHDTPEAFPETEKWQGRIEIKPVVADDYPAVLRQMMRHKTDYLYVGEYVGEGASEAQFVEMFARSGRRIVFKREVDAMAAS